LGASVKNASGAFSGPKELYANQFSTSTNLPGGTLKATSSDTSDTANIVTGPQPDAQFTTTVKSAQAGDRTLTLAYTSPDGQSYTQKFSVTALQFAFLTNSTPSNTCGLAYGTNRIYIYTVNADPGQQAVNGTMSLGGTAATESFNPALTCGQYTGNGSLNANGQLLDKVFSVCSSAPLTCSDTTTQSLSVAGYPVRTNSLAWTSTGINYTSNGPTQ